MRDQDTSSIRMQRLLVVVSIFLFLIKMIAWYITNSVAILTDALESTVNVVAGFIGLYSVILSTKPKDKEHPYGHGKVEFLSSAIEGILIIVAGFVIIYKALENLIHPHNLKQLDSGLILIAITAFINYALGYACLKKGQARNSPALIASGSHLKTDTYSTIGLIAGILLLMVTKLWWIDSVAAIIFAFIILYTGYKIIRKSVGGMMDEFDTEIIEQVTEILNQSRQAAWIDIHNLRVIDYVGFYHIDCHLTVPRYYSVEQGHDVLESLTKVLNQHFESRVEFFIHVDPCIDTQCSLCAVSTCKIRQKPFERVLELNQENLLSDTKHSL
jgi:cation diffusion facilitator family transporter